MPLCRQVVYKFVECFAAAYPTPHLALEKRADFFESVSALRVLLPGHRLADLTERVLTGRRHSPSEEAAPAGVGPGGIRGC